MTLAANAGFLGIPLAAILISWFFKYAYVLFDHVVRGVDDPPALDIQMVNPFNEQRPLAQIIIVGAVGTLVTISAYRLPWAVAVGLAATATLLLPASVAILGLEGNILKALYPVALARMIAGLGLTYVKVLGIIGGYATMILLLAKFRLWLPVELDLAMFAVLSTFSALGGALYERRHELGLETWHSPERTAEAQRQEDRREGENTVTQAYGLVRASSHVEAWQLLQTWLGSRGHAADDYRWLCESLTSWPDSRYVNRLTEEFIDRLLLAKRNGEALDAVAKRLRLDPHFRPKSAASTLQIAQLAVRGGGAPGVARLLLGDFGERFAGSPLVETAASLARHWGK